jgi:hypothetical protein
MKSQVPEPVRSEVLPIKPGRVKAMQAPNPSFKRISTGVPASAA